VIPLKFSVLNSLNFGSFDYNDCNGRAKGVVDVVPCNFLRLMSQNYNWQLMIVLIVMDVVMNQVWILQFCPLAEGFRRQFRILKIYYFLGCFSLFLSILGCLSC